jgi:hypothetical protein
MFITLDQGAAGRFTNSSDLFGIRALETTGASVIKPSSLTAQINKLGQATLSEWGRLGTVDLLVKETCFVWYSNYQTQVI